MPRLPRIIALLLAAALLAGAVAAPAGALTRHQVFGISNIDPNAFSSTALQRLKPKATRMLVNWRVALTRGPARDEVDLWYTKALAAGLQPLVCFEGYKQHKVPSVRQYTRAVRAAVRRWPRVRQWQAWNEANHRTQPATFRHPERAAAYAKALERVARGHTVLPVTIVLTNGRQARLWNERFVHAYGRSPHIWAVHDYSDANRFTYQRLRTFLDRWPHGRVWITETGALAKFGRSFKYNLKRQQRATRWVFKAATMFRSRVDRLYWWQWQGALNPRRVKWDSGLLTGTGKPRPAYRTALRYRFAKR